jgi:hypothetical protein
MNSSRLVILISSFVIISLITGYFIYNNYYIVETSQIKMNMTVGNNVGFVLNNDALYFGTTYPKGQSRRTVTFVNDFGFPVVVHIKADGELAEYLSVEKNNFPIEPNSRENIVFTATAPEDVLNVTFNGSVKINFKRKI